MADTNSPSSSPHSPAADRETNPKTPETHVEKGPSNDLTPVKRDHPGGHGPDSEGESSFDGSSGFDDSGCSEHEAEPNECYSYVDAVRLGMLDDENGGWKCLRCGRIGMQQPYHVCEPMRPESDDDSSLLENEQGAPLHDDDHDDGSNNSDCETMPEHVSSASSSSTLIRNDQ